MNAPITATPPAQPIDFNTRVGQFVKLRDKIAEIKEAHKTELAPFNEAMETLENMLLDHLNTIGADSVSSPAGNVHKTMKKSATIADKEAFWTYMVTQGKFELMDYKANAVRVKALLEEMADQAKTDPTVVPIVPGVNYTEIAEVGVRRGSGK